MSSELSNAIGNVMSAERDVREATAPYEAEFPYERDEEEQVTRREFCNFLVLTSTAFFLGAAGFSAVAALEARRSAAFAPEPIDGAKDMQPGSALNFHYPNENETAILIRAKDGSYAAFGQKCTHLSCPVYYSKANDRLECPCHEGGFDAKTGDVLYGPPNRPLDKIDIEVRGGQVVAVGREVRGNES
jgi:cytochrome b6-f complex iron-sulfur subunit